MDINLIAILIPMILGFIAVVFSVHGLIRSDMNRRFDDQKEDMNRRFDEVDKKFSAIDGKFALVDSRFALIDKKFDEIKSEIHGIRTELHEVRSRLDIYIDNFALRLATAGMRAPRKKP